MDFDGALELERAWREGLTPDPLLSVPGASSGR